MFINSLALMTLACNTSGILIIKAAAQNSFIVVKSDNVYYVTSETIVLNFYFAERAQPVQNRCFFHFY